MSGDEWSALYSMDDGPLYEYLRSQEVRLKKMGQQSCIWESPDHGVLQNYYQKGDPTLQDTITLKGLHKSAIDYMDALRNAHNNDIAIRSQLYREHAGITLETLPLDKIDKEDRTCNICLEQMLDTDVTYKNLRKSSEQEHDASQIERTYISCPGEAGVDNAWEMKMFAHGDLIDNSLDRWNVIVKKELLPFIYGLICATHRDNDQFRDDPGLQGCIGPVRLTCGHIFGFSCISKWLYKKSRTCPFCRLKPRTKKSRVPIDRPVNESGEDIPAEGRRTTGILAPFVSRQ